MVHCSLDQANQYSQMSLLRTPVKLPRPSDIAEGCYCKEVPSAAVAVWRVGGVHPKGKVSGVCTPSGGRVAPKQCRVTLNLEATFSDHPG